MLNTRSTVFKLTVSPADALNDEKVVIKLGGLISHQKVTLRASLRAEDEAVFESYASYTADGEGNVDVSKMHAEDGTYKGDDQRICSCVYFV